MQKQTLGLWQEAVPHRYCMAGTQKVRVDVDWIDVRYAKPRAANQIERWQVGRRQVCPMEERKPVEKYCECRNENDAFHIETSDEATSNDG